jgi:magnesium-transporting ATPase (P-type)
LTSLTGFLFPFTTVTPAIKLGIISLVVLAIAIVTRYVLHLTWRKTYVIAACAALYFNVFVLVVQSFQKIPSLKALAPTQKEPPFAIAQITVLLLFVVLTIFAVKRFRTAA